VETQKPWHPLDPLVKKLRQWGRLDARDAAAIRELPYELEHVQAGAFIVHEGERPTRSCLLISGFAFRQKLVADGGRSISAIHMRGDMVDLQNSFLGLADHSVQALTRCSVAFIPREAVKEVAFAFPNVGMAMWHDTLVDAAIFREWIANIGRRNAASRMAHLLCEFGVRFEAAGLGSKFARRNKEFEKTRSYSGSLSP
jgi:CRP-like cAMP-binding protein